MANFGTSQSVRRFEDPRLLRGEGQYVADFCVPGQVYAALHRSPMASGRITSVDTGAARSMPGVRAVYTSADLDADGIGELPCMVPLKNRDGSPMANPGHPVLARGFVRHVGDPVAMVVADTVSHARDAAEAILVQYETLPAAVDLATATNPDQPLVWADVPRNTVFDWEMGDRALTEKLFAGAAHVTKLRLINNRIVVASMETRAALAEYDATTGKWTLTTNTQGGWNHKSILSKLIFQVPEEKFRIVTPDVGGGFGMKGFFYAEQALTCYAARKLNRAVKWVSERGEAFLSDTQGRDNITTIEIALDKDATFLALRTHTLAGMGAYLSNFAPFIPTMAGGRVLASVYGFRAMHANVIGVFTHTVPVDAYRGAGRPESNYAVERCIDQAARELGIDRIDLRRRNMVPSSAMPWKTAAGAVYDSGEFARLLDLAAERIDWDGFPARRAEAASRGLKRGLGIAYYLEATGGGPSERAEICFAEDGFVDVYVGTQSNGQGHETSYMQLTAARLGIPIEKIRVRQGDTDRIPVGGGTGGARSLNAESQAILLTAETVIGKGQQAAGEMLEASPADIVFEDGKFAITGTDRSIGILDLAAAQLLRAREGKPAVLLDAAEIAKVQHGTYPNGCHMVEVEIDPETGSLKIVRYLVVDDMGHVLNPMLVLGQIHGGIAQGLGQAIMENATYDSESGQLLTGSFMDYAMPRAEDMPDIEVELIEVPCTTNPLGVKGAGEAGTVGAAPALVNAVIDALADAGVTAIDMPLTPEVLWRAASGHA